MSSSSSRLRIQRAFLGVLWLSAAMLLPVLLAPIVGAAGTFAFDTNETVITGTCNNQTLDEAEDGSFEDCVEADTASSDVNTIPGTETLTTGTRQSGTFPTDIESSNDVDIVYREANTASSDVDTYPTTETQTKGTRTGGTFNTCIQTSDDSDCSYQEADQDPGDTVDAADTETITTGTKTGGTFPTDIESSNDVDIVYQEEDVSSTTDLQVDSQNLVTGTQPGGTFPTDARTSNNAYVTYREANTGGGGGSIAFDATYSGGCAGCTIFSWTHTTVSTTDGLLVVGISFRQASGATTVSDVTYDSTSITHLTAADVTNSGNSRSETWYKIGTLTGGKTIEVTLSASENAQAGSVSFTGAHQTAPAGNSATATGSASPATVDVTSATDEIVLDTLAMADGTTCTVGTGQTQRWNNKKGGGGAAIRGCGSTETGSSTTTMSWTLGKDKNWAIAATGWKPTGGTANYEMNIENAWTGETCADTRRLRIEAYHTDTEDILVQVDDGSDAGTFVTRITVTATSDPNTYQTYDLTAAEWDAGEPLIRYLGNTETGDSTQTDFVVDHVQILCVPPANYQLEIQYDWTGVGTADTHRLIVEGTEMNGGDTEDVLVQVWDFVSAWTTAYTMNTDTDTTYNSYTLSTGEYNSGAPRIRFIGATETGDTTQGTMTVDYAVIQLEHNPDYELEIRYDWASVPSGDSYLLTVECTEFDAGDTEDLLVQVLTPPSTWTTRYTCISDTDATFNTYSLTTAEYNSGAPAVRFIGAEEDPDDGTQGTMTLDYVVITTQYTAAYNLEIRYDWASVPGGDTWRLFVEAATAADEDFLVQVLMPPSTWNTRLTYTLTTDVNQTYDLTTAEYNSGAPAIRFVDGTADDTTQSDFNVDAAGVLTITTSYSMEMTEEATGIDSDPATLHVKGYASDPATENWDVYLWAWGNSSYDLIFDSVFTGTNTDYTVDLDESAYISGGTARIRFLDDDIGDDAQSTLYLDWVAIVTTTSNVSPVIDDNDPSDQDVQHNRTYAVVLNATDDNGDSLSWTLSTNASFLGLEYNSSAGGWWAWVNGTPGYADSEQTYYVNASVSDSSLTDYVNYTLWVNNTSPVIVDPIESENLQHNVTLVHRFNGTDAVNNDDLSWTVEGNATGIGIEWNSTDSGWAAWVNWTPTYAQSGGQWYRVWVNVTDGYGTASDVSQWFVNNTAPVISVTPDQEHTHNATYSQSATASDANGDTRTWTFYSNASFLSMEQTDQGGTSWVNGTPAYADSEQSYSIWLNVSDGYDSDTSSWTLWVNNTVPIIDSNDKVDRSEPADTSFSWAFNGTDGNGDDLSWTWATDAPSCTQLEQDGGDAWVNDTGTGCSTGTYWGNITLEDGYDNDYHNFTITIGAVNAAPVIDPDDKISRQAEENVVSSWEYNATDDDNEPLTWSWVSNLDCVSLEYDNWTAWLNTTVFCNDGSYWGNLSVDDGNGGTDYANFTITVLRYGGGSSGSIIPDFSWAADSLVVCFFDKTEPAPTEVEWLFGDGASSTERQPCHAYPDRGRYNVTYRIWDASHDLYQVTKSVTVIPAVPWLVFLLQNQWVVFLLFLIFVTVLYLATRPEEWWRKVRNYRDWKWFGWKK